jgi:hypothetical protein
MNKVKTLFLKTFNLQEIPEPKRPKRELSLNDKWILAATTKGCDNRNCSDCKINCKINRYRQEIKQLRVSFCPDDKSKCERLKIQGCIACHWEHLDLSVLHASIPIRSLTKQLRSQPIVIEAPINHKVVNDNQLLHDKQLLQKHSLLPSIDEINQLEQAYKVKPSL